MKASELVALLNAEIEKYGDLEVKYCHTAGETTPKEVTVYNYDETETEIENIFIY